MPGKVKWAHGVLPYMASVLGSIWWVAYYATPGKATNSNEWPHFIQESLENSLRILKINGWFFVGPLGDVSAEKAFLLLNFVIKSAETGVRRFADTQRFIQLSSAFTKQNGQTHC